VRALRRFKSNNQRRAKCSRQKSVLDSNFTSALLGQRACWRRDGIPIVLLVRSCTRTGLPRALILERRTVCDSMEGVTQRHTPPPGRHIGMQKDQCQRQCARRRPMMEGFSVWQNREDPGSRSRSTRSRGRSLPRAMCRVRTPSGPPNAGHCHELAQIGGQLPVYPGIGGSSRHEDSCLAAARIKRNLRIRRRLNPLTFIAPIVISLSGRSAALRDLQSLAANTSGSDEMASPLTHFTATDRIKPTTRRVQNVARIVIPNVAGKPVDHVIVSVERNACVR
jgi:hypothetical protein